MSNVDWGKAPEGAEYWCDQQWFKTIDGEWRPGIHVWAKSPYGAPANFSWWWNAVKRPATPQWNGEGLPPVGMVCEVDYEGWTRCEIIAHFQQRCGMVAAFTIDIGDGAKLLDAFGADYFRPLRTPEQIAAEERDKAIDDMVMIACMTDSPRSMAAKLYDAGYRKQERPE